MKHTVLVPAWRRPDMLHACLSRLEQAATPDVQIVVSLDRGYSPECYRVAKEFSSKLPALYMRLMHSHQYRGNSCNVLSGLADCVKLGTELVHVVEEDIMVSRGYFTFHEAMHRVAPDVFAVSACRNQNAPGASDVKLVYAHASYQSLGVSFRAGTIQHFLKHETPLYYGDMVGYCRKKFPGSRLPPGHAEQDGLINRIRESIGGKTVYASRPRAYHAGFHGYNRSGAVLTEGSIEDRARMILGMTSGELNELAGDIKDHQVIDLDEELSTSPEEESLKEEIRGGHRNKI